MYTYGDITKSLNKTKLVLKIHSYVKVCFDIASLVFVWVRYYSMKIDFLIYARTLSNIVRLVSHLNKQKHPKKGKLKDSSYRGREKRNALIINIFEFFS
jgi:hypothetical protein